MKRRYVGFFQAVNFSYFENNKFHNTENENNSPKILYYRKQKLNKNDSVASSPIRNKLSQIKEIELDEICKRYPDNLLKKLQDKNNLYYSKAELSKSQPTNMFLTSSNISGELNKSDRSTTKLSIADRTSI